MIIVSQVGLFVRATDLRKIGTCIRHEAFLGQSTDHPFDLRRRRKVAPSPKKTEGITQTIAGLCSDPINCVLNAGLGWRRPHGNQVAIQVPNLESSAKQAFSPRDRTLSCCVTYHTASDSTANLVSAPLSRRGVACSRASTSRVTPPRKSRPGSSAYVLYSVRHRARDRRRNAAVRKREPVHGYHERDVGHVSVDGSRPDNVLLLQFFLDKKKRFPEMLQYTGTQPRSQKPGSCLARVIAA